MTKEMFEQYDNELFCVKCKHYVPKVHIDYRRVYSDGHISKCNVCYWIERNFDKTICSDYSQDEIIEFLHCIIYQKEIYLNNIAIKLNRTLEDMIKLWTFLKIANRTCLIKTTCELCGKEIEYKPKAYISSQYHYCSHDCYYQDKSSKMPKGENNPCYNRINVQCTNCGNDISIIPYRYKKLNAFGDSNNFCSQECYAEYRSKYYNGVNAPCYNREWTKDEKEKMRSFQLQYSVNSERLNTKPQKILDDILSDLNIDYLREKVFDYYAVDNYLVNDNGIIEVMGDYWHSNPLRYNADHYFLNDIQARQLHRDKIKYSYIRNHYKIPILYIWENDLKKNLETCVLLIQQYIACQCILPNYHSFNWSVKNKHIQLNTNLIIPYQDMGVKEYRFLIKQKTG